MLELRGHARGGQGMVTAFEILAKIFSRTGEYQVQAFPFFGVERTGAPIMAFFRIDKDEILNRSNIYYPNLIVVFDENLIDQISVFDGLRKGGTILINTDKTPEHFSKLEELKDVGRIFTLPATKISLKKGLGSKSLPIVNSAMIGGLIRILDADIEIAKEIIKENVPAKPEPNAEAAEAAYSSLVGNLEGDSNLFDSLHGSDGYTSNGVGSGGHKKVSVSGVPENAQWDQPMSLNKTGNWRVLAPKYVMRQPPCTGNCPAGTDVRKFVEQTSKKDFAVAYQTILEHNPFPSTCGRVCPHFCQQNCNRSELDENLNIGAIERFLGDKAIEDNIAGKEGPVEIKGKEKIAVIGSGPAGLTAALRLRKNGYKTTVFEALDKAGGMMRVGIPGFRLPQDILDEEIKAIENQGVEIILGKKVKIEELEEDYAVAVVATGLHLGSKMGIEGEEAAVEGLDFLHEFKMNGNDRNIKKGDKVAVIGGGNTAIDVARTVLRLGGKSTIYYRRTKEEMPAIPHEIEEAQEEGVLIEFLMAPVSIESLGDGGFNVSMIKMELGEADDSGRRRPIPVEGSEKTQKVDAIITAIGQKSDAHAFAGNEVDAQQGKLEYQAKIPVFCSGDMAWGGTVTEAIGSGNLVAKEVLAHLEGKPYEPEASDTDIVTPEDINYAYYIRTPSHKNVQNTEGDLFNNYDEVIEGIAEEKIVAEASRCFHCGDCYNCGNCINYCPDAAIHLDEDNRLRIDYDFCKGCGICFQECPSSAIELKFEEEMAIKG